MSAAGAQEFGSAANARIALRAHRDLPWLLMPQGVPLQILIDATPVRVPNTRSWFRGVVSQRGNLLPVFDLAGWAGLETDEQTRPLVVAIGAGQLSCAVIADFSPMLIVPEEATTQANDDGALSGFLGQGYACAQGDAREFDFRRWLTAAAQQINDVASG